MKKKAQHKASKIINNENNQNENIYPSANQHPSKMKEENEKKK